MNDHVKRAARKAVALAKLHEAQAELDRIATEQAERLAYDLKLARGTVHLLAAVDAGIVEPNCGDVVWEFREQLAPLAESHGARIVESATRKNVAALEYI